MFHKFQFLLLLGLLICSSCAQDSNAVPQNSGSGTGGSLARFTIVGDYLYTLSVSNLHVFNISNPAEPSEQETVNVGSGVETIFPFGNWLFMGTQNGMLIYSIGSNGVPEYVSSYAHVRSCDPVVTDGEFAYVTLRVSGCRTAAEDAIDVLDVIDLENIESPRIIASKEMNSPRGLGLDGDVLFVCDGTSGLEVFDVSDPSNPQTITKVADIIAFDVIPLNGNLLVLGPDNIYQYDYTQLPELVKLSEMAIN